MIHLPYTQKLVRVPHGSVLWPVLFTLYILPLGKIVRKKNINFNCYLDDTQQYLSVRPDETNQLVKLQACLKNITIWMTSILLPLNSDNYSIVPKHLQNELSNNTINGIPLASSTTFRNLEILFDQDMSFNSHIKQTSRPTIFSYVTL